MMIFERLMMMRLVFVVGLVIWRWKDEGFWCVRLGKSWVRVLVKFGQSLATCGSEWEEIRVQGINRGEKRVTFGQKRVTFLDL